MGGEDGFFFFILVRKRIVVFKILVVLAKS